MCGRVIIPSNQAILFEMQLKSADDQHRPAQINVPPGGGAIPIITDSKPDMLQYFAWPLVPSFSKEKKSSYSTSNATIERLHESNNWNRLIGRKHCIVITSGFYEWQYDDPENKIGGHPHVIKTKGKNLTLMAGLWDVWVDKSTGEMFPSCTIITLPANQFMSKIHNTKGRMPAFLTNETAKIWADKSLCLKDRETALHPVSDDFLYAQEVRDVKDEEEVNAVISIC